MLSQVNIMHTLSKHTKEAVFKQLHASYMSIYDKYIDVPRKENPVYFGYSKLLEIGCDNNLSTEVRLEALTLVLYKQNVFEIDYLAG